MKDKINTSKFEVSHVQNFTLYSVLSRNRITIYQRLQPESRKTRTSTSICGCVWLSYSHLCKKLPLLDGLLNFIANYCPHTLYGSIKHAHTSKLLSTLRDRQHKIFSLLLLCFLVCSILGTVVNQGRQGLVFSCLLISSLLPWQAPEVQTWCSLLGLFAEFSRRTWGSWLVNGGAWLQ